MAGGAPTGIDIPPGESEDLSGRELADATVMILSGFDRTQGPVQTRSVVDALLRRGRLGGDTMLASAQLTAALRADNMRRLVAGQRPRFRFAMSNQGSRIALTDWALSSGYRPPPARRHHGDRALSRGRTPRDAPQAPGAPRVTRSSSSCSSASSASA